MSCCVDRSQCRAPSHLVMEAGKGGRKEGGGKEGEGKGRIRG